MQTQAGPDTAWRSCGKAAAQKLTHTEQSRTQLTICASDVARALIYGHRFFQPWWRFSSWGAHVAWRGCGSNICLLLAVTSCVFGLTGVSVGINNLCPTGGFTANTSAPEFYISITKLLLSYVHVWWRKKKRNQYNWACLFEIGVDNKWGNVAQLKPRVQQYKCSSTPTLNQYLHTHATQQQ